MNDNQAASLRLLDEIDQICKANNIKYYIHADTAAMAIKSGCYEGEYLSTAIEMTTQDARKFIAAFEANPVRGRVIEHMGNSAEFPGFKMRYVDTNTLYVPFNYYTNYQNKGIAIDFFFIRKSLSSKLFEKMWLMLEIGIEQNCLFSQRKFSKKATISKNVVSFLQLFWPNSSMRRFFFDRWLKMYECAEEDKTWVRKPYGRRRSYPQCFMSDPVEVEFEGRVFPAFARTGLHIKKWKGAGWKKGSAGMVKPGPNLLIDARVSFDDLSGYLDQSGFDLNAAIAHHVKTRELIAKRTHLNKQKKQYWETAYAVRTCNRNIDKAIEKRDKIIALYESGAYREASYELRRYEKALLKNEEAGRPRGGDPGLTEIVSELRVARGLEPIR